MVKTKIAKSAGRFGVRYGPHVRRKIADIEGKQRLKQPCPFCNGRAKRLSKGIWLCKKCKKKFAAHAYFLEKGELKVKIVKEEAIEQKEEKESNQAKPAKKKGRKKSTKSKSENPKKL